MTFTPSDTVRLKQNKMRIPTKDLQEFIKRTSAIQTNGIMPILGYYLLEGATITKTNLSSFCKHAISYSGEPLNVLLEEIIIKSIVNNTNADGIEISVNGKQVTITAGKQKQSFETVDAIDFPKFPSGSGERTLLNKQAINSLFISARYVGTNSHNYNYVHSTSNDVFACNGFTMYHKQFESLPKLILTPDSVNLLSQFDSATHYFNGTNVDFFDVGDTVYGFVRPEVKSPTYLGMVEQAKTSNGIKFDKQQIERFCQTTLDITENEKDLVCKIKDNGENECLFVYANSGTKKRNELPLTVEGKCSNMEDFSFNPRQVLTALRALPYDYIWFVFQDNKAFIYNEDDKDYKGIIMATLN